VASVEGNKKEVSITCVKNLDGRSAKL